ncbi:TfoX/Sxy family protein [Micromonospora sp. MP36]|uniref:TfoX/Sxy family protein n=1 Tax=Micromonospora sp. MP36 TaxID=2604468 RepID=UPI0011D70F17|nr:TfoX/Sxy family protein [Micromonospora sp. MP36]TYC21776.1 TfoX/Sxy family protein [Micromonospora sp. MP36]
MQMPKPSDADKDFFRSVVADVPGVEVKPMFGNLGAFVNGNMFAGLFGSSVGVKLAADDLAELGTIEGAGPFGPAERPRGGYLSLPPSFTAEEATRWVNKAHAYVATLPPKKKKK